MRGIDIEAMTASMMPSSVGVNIGYAAGLAERCGYRLDDGAVEQAANLNALRPQMLQPGGVSRHLWAEGYQRGLALPRSESLCQNALAMFGPSGNTIPHLMSE
ncbi:hypothetical protein [Pelagibacterium sp.]|uniref:hypothetical protein n=1 Tax=Pelagibacterium sp. TaxID=1967288 RepID=UPI003A8D998D